MDKNRRYSSLQAEDLENRAAPWTAPVLRDPVIVEPEQPPVPNPPVGSSTGSDEPGGALREKHMDHEGHERYERWLDRRN